MNVGTRPGTGALAGLAAAMLAAAGGSLEAQAVCSAPHSSPILARGGSIGTLPPGAGWIQLAVFRQRSTAFFSSRGERQDFLADGRVEIITAYATGAFGIAPGLDAWLQLPMHQAQYRDASGSRERSGFGDPRFSLRLTPELVGAPGLPLAVRVGAKLPGSRFPVDATIIPLTEGQRDVEVSIESGHSFRAIPLYGLGWIGHRWRSENRDADRKPGDEVFAHLALGGTVSFVRAELAADWLDGGTPRHVGIDLTTARRRLFQIVPTLAARLGPGDLELTTLIPLSGRNVPTGTAVSVGYRVGWGLDPAPEAIQPLSPTSSPSR